jgi:tetratricopeptide (TPR) repeat protein
MKRNRRLELVSLRATGGSGKKSWTASEFARREEEKSRLERAGDVVIGKTSALAGASDYVLDPKATAEEWMRQASKVEQEVYRQTEEGMEMLKMLRLEEADKAFDRVFELRPEAYLWQAGIAKYYLGDVKAAADIFTRNAATFETKFCEPASEERIWRHACELKIYHTMSKDEKKRVLESGGIESLLPPIPENDSTVELLRSESRKAIRITRELFSASVAGDYSGLILARAKLRSIGGAFEEQPKADRKMWKINAWFYLGLHYDALGKYEESKKCMKMALQLCPSFGNGVDIVHTLPMLHMAQRDWFDDDDFVESWTLSESTEKSKRTDPKVSDPAVTDPVVVESIKVSIAGMKLSELKDALKVRGLKTAASKEELQGRLFQSLMDDTGQ